MPTVPLLLAIGGVTLAASLFATWFDVTVVSFSGFEPPTGAALDAVREQLDQTGWEFWDGGDVAFFALGLGLVALAAYDAARRRVPHPVLAAAGVLCAVALVIVAAEGFDGDTVALVEGTLGEGAGAARIARGRAGGQWVAVVGLVVALIGLGLGWRERRPGPAGQP
jgi:hypothetical protein